MSEYRKHLAKDRIGKILLKTETDYPKRKKNVMMSLISSIIGQQLSTLVARIIRKRFLELYDGKAPSADQVLETAQEDLRSIGLSNNKISYIKNVAQFFKDHNITVAKLNKMSDEEIIDQFVQIKGVGRWTVEMILIFSLGREDVFALDDLAVQKEMIKLFKWKPMPKKLLHQKMLEASKRWAPYRTYVCLHLWGWKDK